MDQTQTRATNGNGGSSTFARPSAIDNSDLICESASEDPITTGVQLRDNLVEGTDYILLPKLVWNELYAW